MPRPWTAGRPWRMQAKTNAWSRIPLIMYSACHSFCLAMQLRAWSAYSQPRPMMCKGCGGGASGVIRPSGHEAERWGQGAESRAGDGHLVRVVEVAVLNVRIHALHQFRLMNFK